MALGINRYVGLCEESTFAESPPEAQFYIDVESCSLDAPSDSEIVYEGSRGRGYRLHRPGYYKCDGDVEYAFDIRSIGWFLKWALGGYAFSGNLHEIYGDDTYPPSFCTRVGKDIVEGGNFEHVFSGCKLDSLELSIEDSWTTCKAGIKASVDSRDDIKSAAIVESYMATEDPMVFHEVTVSRDNGDISAKAKSLTLSIANNINVDGGRSLGSRYARRLNPQARNTKLTMGLYYDSIEDLQLLWGGAEGPASAGSGEFPLVVTFAYVEGGTLEIVFPRFCYTSVPIQSKGRDEIDVKAEGVAFAAETTLADDTPIVTEILCNLTNDEDEMELGGS